MDVVFADFFKGFYFAGTLLSIVVFYIYSLRFYIFMASCCGQAPTVVVRVRLANTMFC